MAFGIRRLCILSVPFSLTSACCLFTKLLHPLVRYRRVKGLRLMFLADGLCVFAGYSLAMEASLLVCRTLDCPGFVAYPTGCK